MEAVPFSLHSEMVPPIGYTETCVVPSCIASKIPVEFTRFIVVHHELGFGIVEKERAVPV